MLLAARVCLCESWCRWMKGYPVSHKKKHHELLVDLLVASWRYTADLFYLLCINYTKMNENSAAAEKKLHAQCSENSGTSTHNIILHMNNTSNRYGPKCNMLVCHSADMRHGLFVTMPICTMDCLSQCRYAPWLVCHNANMHRGLFVRLFVTMLICTMDCLLQCQYAPWIVTMPICTMDCLSQCQYAPWIVCQIVCHCADMHHGLFVTMPICTMDCLSDC